MLWIPIDRTSEIPLMRQIYQCIRQRILAGELSAHEQLPSTRELAADLGVSRNVVLDAYDQLIAEGYLEGHQGAGTYVADGACWPKQERTDPLITYPPLHTGQLLRSPLSEVSSQPNFPGIDFRSGIPALDQFPRKRWAALTKAVCTEAPSKIFSYGEAAGSIELRQALAGYLLKTRGVRCQPQHIVITSGAAQAFFLLAKLLLSEHDWVVVEDPITIEIQQRFTSVGASLWAIAVDAQGIETQHLPTQISPRFTLVTPSHQFPLGSVLTIQRRIELLQFAQATGGWVVEDDYDSEFRYTGTPVSSLQGLAPEQVIYVGTMSKILSPALRIGYLVLPESLVEPCCQLRLLDDLHTSSIEQLTLARFITEGDLERHISRMKKLYRARRKALKQSLYNSFGDRVKILGDSTGLHLIAEFADVEFSESLLHHLEAHQVRVYPVERHAIAKGFHHNQIILGYANLTPEAIAQGIDRLKAAL
jgi:GntR family transcriptional regulator/MocR family aminotransferase